MMPEKFTTLLKVLMGHKGHTPFSKISSFHAVFGTNWSNSRLTPPPWGVGTSSENHGSATAAIAFPITVKGYKVSSSPATQVHGVHEYRCFIRIISLNFIRIWRSWFLVTYALVMIIKLFQLVTFLPFSLPVQSCKSVTVTTQEALRILVYCDYELNRNWIYEPEVEWKLLRVLSLPLWKEIFRELLFIRMIYFNEWFTWNIKEWRISLWWLVCKIVALS